MSEANSKQVGGNHYQNIGGAQHWDFATSHKMCYLLGCATKYLCRCNSKHKSPIEDLKKAAHYVEKTIECCLNGLIEPNEEIPSESIGVSELCVAYNLNEELFSIVFDLTYWHDAAMLKGALDAINILIDEQ